MQPRSRLAPARSFTLPGLAENSVRCSPARGLLRPRPLALRRLLRGASLRSSASASAPGGGGGSGDPDTSAAAALSLPTASRSSGLARQRVDALARRFVDAVKKAAATESADAAASAVDSAVSEFEIHNLASPVSIALARVGGVSALVACMRAHAGSARVQGACVSALGCVSSSTGLGGISKAEARAAFDATLQALPLVSGDALCQTLALGVLCSTLSLLQVADTDTRASAELGSAAGTDEEREDGGAWVTSADAEAALAAAREALRAHPKSTMVQQESLFLLVRALGCLRPDSEAERVLRTPATTDLAALAAAAMLRPAAGWLVRDRGTIVLRLLACGGMDDVRVKDTDPAYGWLVAAAPGSVEVLAAGVEDRSCSQASQAMLLMLNGRPPLEGADADNQAAAAATRGGESGDSDQKSPRQPPTASPAEAAAAALASAASSFATSSSSSAAPPPPRADPSGTVLRAIRSGVVEICLAVRWQTPPPAAAAAAGGESSADAALLGPDRLPLAPGFWWEAILAAIGSPEIASAVFRVRAATRPACAARLCPDEVITFSCDDVVCVYFLLSCPGSSESGDDSVRPRAPLRSAPGRGHGTDVRGHRRPGGRGRRRPLRAAARRQEGQGCDAGSPFIQRRAPPQRLRSAAGAGDAARRDGAAGRHVPRPRGLGARAAAAPSPAFASAFYRRRRTC